MAVEHLPLNTSGKLNRKIIRQWLEELDKLRYERVLILSGISPEDDTARGGQTQQHVLQNNASVQGLLKSWATALKMPIDSITRSSSFFASGGDSLSAINLVQLCRKNDVEVTVQEIFQTRTFGNLFEIVASRSLQQEKAEVTDGTCHGFPPSEYQRLMIARGAAEKGESDSLCWRIVPLSVEVPQQRIRDAIDMLVHRNPVLRTVLKSENGHLLWVKNSNPKTSYRTKFSQYASLNDAQVRELHNEALDSIDISEGPVFSADIYRTSAGTSLLLVSHPIIIDELSWVFMLKDIDVVIAAKTTPERRENVFSQAVRPESLQKFDTIQSTGSTSRSEKLLLQWSLSSPRLLPSIYRKSNCLRSTPSNIVLTALCHEARYNLPMSAGSSILIDADARIGKTKDSIGQLRSYRSLDPDSLSVGLDSTFQLLKATLNPTPGCEAIESLASRTETDVMSLCFKVDTESYIPSSELLGMYADSIQRNETAYSLPIQDLEAHITVEKTAIHISVNYNEEHVDQKTLFRWFSRTHTRL